MWVIVEIERSIGTTIELVGPFANPDTAEAERRRRYFARYEESPLNTSRWFESHVRQVVAP